VSELAAGRITIATAKPFNRRISDDAPRRSCSCLGWRELRRRLSLLRRHAVKRSTALGLAGEVIYSDNDAVDEGLVSHRYGLTGKPDYISREGEELIPVERKSRSISEPSLLLSRPANRRRTGVKIKEPSSFVRLFFAALPVPSLLAG
jgi:hypothetical protein